MEEENKEYGYHSHCVLPTLSFFFQSKSAERNVQKLVLNEYIGYA